MDGAASSLSAPEVASAFLISATSLSSEWEDILSLREWWLICDGSHGEVEAVTRWERGSRGQCEREGFCTPIGYPGKRANRPAVEAGRCGGG